MKMFFAGSIRGGGGYGKVYRRIIALLNSHGEVISEHLYNNGSTKKEGENSDAAIHARDLEAIRQSDLVFAEVSHPSIGVGYEIGIAESIGIPVIALYHGGSEHRLSAMIAGNKKIVTLTYDTFEELSVLLAKEMSRFSP
ncbi:MAG: nucleoside 2-deoxyribosyltransferase [Geobacteraceae bacterium]|nr:nucleoside 2-deoxyribosyltransferase [Geobacteraceae bacterium]